MHECMCETSCKMLCELLLQESELFIQIGSFETGQMRGVHCQTAGKHESFKVKDFSVK